MYCWGPNQHHQPELKEIYLPTPRVQVLIYSKTVSFESNPKNNEERTKKNA